MPRSHLSYAFLFGLIGSIAALRFWEKTEYPLWIWPVIFMGIIAGFLSGKKYDKRGWLLFAALLGIFLGFLRIAETTHVKSPASIDWYADGRKIDTFARIARVPERRIGGTRYLLQMQKIDDVAEPKGLVRADDNWTTVRFAEGDLVQVKGVLTEPQSDGQTDYKRIFGVRGIWATLQEPSLKLIKTQPSASPIAFLGRTKLSLEERVSKLFPEPYGSLLIGLLTGSQGRIPPEVTSAFTTNGLTHILAISGFNITLVLSLVEASLFFLPRKWRFLPAGIAVTAFTLFTGASASAVRACIMGCLGLFALQNGRTSTMRLLILWAMAGMLFLKPQSFWDDAGFQLSFLAVIGLSECSDVFEKLTGLITEKSGLREQLHATLTAQLLTTPWMAYAFGQISLVSPLSNVLVGPFVPIAMLFGAIALGADYLGLHAIQIVLQPIATLPLWWLITVPITLSHLPFASIVVTKNTGLSFCVTIFIIIINRYRKIRASPFPIPKS